MMHPDLICSGMIRARLQQDTKRRQQNTSSSCQDSTGIETHRRPSATRMLKSIHGDLHEDFLAFSYRLGNRGRGSCARSVSRG